MMGPHKIWSGRVASPLKRRRVAAGLTLAALAAHVGASVAQLHRLEAFGAGSASLWNRVADVLSLSVDEIRPAGASPLSKSEDLRQLELLVPRG